MSIAASSEPPLTSYGRDLHVFLDLLPAQLKGERIDELQASCDRLIAAAPAVQDPAERWAGAFARVQQTLRELQVALVAFKKRAPHEMKSAREYVLARYTDAARAYEQWLAMWSAARAYAEERAKAPESLRTLKGARSWFHIAMGMLAACMYQFVITKAQALMILGTLLSVFGTLEITRRFSARWNDFLVTNVFGAIARPREYHKVNSATYYLIALCFVTSIFPRTEVIVGILVLAYGDPAAAWMGKRFGKRKLYRDKSLVGALSFFAAAAIVALGYLFAFHPELSFSMRLTAGLVAAACGAVAELFSFRFDDNLTVPVAAVVSTAAVFALF
jgi:dolichol kinase